MILTACKNLPAAALYKTQALHSPQGKPVIKGFPLAREWNRANN